MRSMPRSPLLGSRKWGRGVRGVCPQACLRGGSGGYVQRGPTERKNRRVTLRPAPDTMSCAVGISAAEQGVASLSPRPDRRS